MLDLIQDDFITTIIEENWNRPHSPKKKHGVLQWKSIPDWADTVHMSLNKPIAKTEFNSRAIFGVVFFI